MDRWKYGLKSERKESGCENLKARFQDCNLSRKQEKMCRRDREHITYIDLCEQIHQILDVKERTAKSYIRFMRERDIILKDPSNQSYFMIGTI